MHIRPSKSNPQQGDEENLLGKEGDSSKKKSSNSYGAIGHRFLPHLLHQGVESSSRCCSSDDNNNGGKRNSIAERKRRRIHRHHHADSSPRLLPRLMRKKSSGTPSSHSSSSSRCSDNESDDTDQEEQDELEEDSRRANLVLPALDPKAEEVIASAASQRSLDQWFARRSPVNFSTVRQKYRTSRKHARDEKTEMYSIYNQIKHYLHWHPYVSRARDLLFANQTIVLIVNIDLLVDALLCLAYLVEMKDEFDVHLSPGWLYKWRSYDLWLYCQWLTFWNLGSFIMRLCMARRLMSVLVSFRSFIELMTTVPFLLSNFMQNGQYLYVPYFLRSWVLLLRIKSAMKIRSNLQMTDKPVDLLRTKLIYLISTLCVVLYNGMAAFQYCEATFGNINYSIIDSIYVVMVTLSTVGYGDITPTTEQSRLVVVFLIVISLAVLPSLIADVLATWRKRKDGGGHVDKGTMPFILIIGAFRLEQMNEILDGFLNREHADPDLNVVFLDINPPSEDMKLMERNSMWGHRIQVLHGSVLNEKTLQRVRARYAKAIFTISDQNASDPSAEDERNTVRLWSLYCYTVSHKVPIYTYNLSPSTAIYQKVAQEIICVREFKQYLLGMNCRCRGASTLLTNLLHQRQPMNRYDEPWQAQYDDGSCNEIYTAPPPDCIIGIPFAQAAWIIYKECQVILFAIKTYAQDRGDDEILLNPSDSYVIKRTDLCVYISESFKEVKDIAYLESRYVFNTVHANQLRRAAQAGAKKTTPVPTPSSSSTTSSKPPARRYKLSRLPTPRHALMTGSRALITRLGQAPVLENDVEDNLASVVHDTQLPLSYILEEPAKLKDVVIDSTEGMRDHILVCLHREVIDIFKFIYNLRSPHMKSEELQDIVILCSSLPTEKNFELINMFPKVYFLVGNCRQPDDLLRAGVKRAKQVVVMSDEECMDMAERNSDSPAIMTSHIIDLLLQERQKNSYTIVNLIEKSNIRFMHLLQDKDVAEEIDVFYTPAYAAGDVVADSLISNVLLSQTYYKPDIVSIIKTLCGMPGPLYDGSAAHLLSSSTEFRTVTAAAMHAPHLTSIPVAPEFANKPFAFMFETLLLDQGVLPLGLLRAPDDVLGNELPFVYTNPVPSLIVKDTDKVFILSSPKAHFQE